MLLWSQCHRPSHIIRKSQAGAGIEPWPQWFCMYPPALLWIYRKMRCPVSMQISVCNLLDLLWISEFRNNRERSISCDSEGPIFFYVKLYSEGVTRPLLELPTDWKASKSWFEFWNTKMTTKKLMKIYIIFAWICNTKDVAFEFTYMCQRLI